HDRVSRHRVAGTAPRPGEGPLKPRLPPLDAARVDSHAVPERRDAAADLADRLLAGRPQAGRLTPARPGIGQHDAEVRGALVGQALAFRGLAGTRPRPAEAGRGLSRGALEARGEAGRAALRRDLREAEEQPCLLLPQGLELGAEALALDGRSAVSPQCDHEREWDQGVRREASMATFRHALGPVDPRA